MPGTSAKITPITSAPCIVKSSLYSPRSSSKTSPMSGMFDIVVSFLESDKYLFPWYSNTTMLLKWYDRVAVAVSTSLTQSVREWLYLFCPQCLALLNHPIHEQVVWLNYNLSHDWYTVIWLSLLEFRMVGFVSFSMSATIIFLGDFSIWKLCWNSISRSSDMCDFFIWQFISETVCSSNSEVFLSKTNYP